MRKKINQNKVILASASPRRREILEQVGIKCDIITSSIEEKVTQSEPNKVVLELSMQKADDVYRKVLNDRLEKEVLDNKEYIIIAADTVVAVDNKIMGKPANIEEAYDMISLIQGRKHNVLTGVTIIVCDGINNSRRFSFYESTEVEIYDMDEDDINKYIETSEPYDKAGAYAIQGLFAKYVKKINGDYYNVVGLPISRIIREIKGFSIEME